MAFHALNLFDLADDSYRRYSRRSPGAVAKHDGRVVALGVLDEAMEKEPEVEPGTAMILVDWASRESFDAFLEDPELADLHPPREDGTRNYLWWTDKSLDDLRPLFARQGPYERRCGAPISRAGSGIFHSSSSSISRAFSAARDWEVRPPPRTVAPITRPALTRTTFLTMY